MDSAGEPAYLRKSVLPGDKSQDRGLNEIGGNLYKRWSAWFNSTVHVKSYQLHSTFYYSVVGVLHGCRQLVP